MIQALREKVSIEVVVHPRVKWPAFPVGLALNEKVSITVLPHLGSQLAKEIALPVVLALR
jgi:hypothetical protein